mgnify:CR=1 FL=1
MIKLKEVIENSKDFKAMQQELSRASKAKQEELREKYNSNAEVQANRAKPKDQTTREAVERMVENRKKYNDFKSGRDTTESQARAETMQLLKRALKNDV